MEVINIAIQVRRCSCEELSESERSLVALAKEQTRNSYAPYSHFHVGAAMLLADGTIACGANQENASYPVGTCAERAALFAAGTSNPGVAPVAVAIAARSGDAFTGSPITPCGMCRQALLEAEHRFSRPIRLLLYGHDATYVVSSVRDLLPLTFDGSDLPGN
ncbi:MAG: cytidine deaminase [Bacteroidaceae bacterium]|nr:cytidine deaminase [Bacteroidaceae bacterium]